jgi:hypothetical protein
MPLPSLLKREAEQIIADLDLMAILQPHGEARVVGSVALDLIVKLDLDLHLVVPRPDLLAVTDAVYHRLLDYEGVREVRISDYRSIHGVKIGIDEYAAPSGTWSIDIWITDHPETGGFELTERLRRELTPEHRQAILEIKRFYHAQDRLRDGMSMNIYLAVLEHGVRSVAAFQKHLEAVAPV